MRQYLLHDVLQPRLPGRVGQPEVPAAEQHQDNFTWKGQISDHTPFAEGDAISDAAWFYPKPEAAAQIKGRVAFWKGVPEVE